MLITHLNSDMTFSWAIPDLDLYFIKFIAKKVDTQVAPSRFRSFLRTELLVFEFKFKSKIQFLNSTSTFQMLISYMWLALITLDSEP